VIRDVIERDAPPAFALTDAEPAAARTIAVAMIVRIKCPLLRSGDRRASDDRSS
jgi:hypothetical protein